MKMIFSGKIKSGLNLLLLTQQKIRSIAEYTLLKKLKKQTEFFFKVAI